MSSVSYWQTSVYGDFDVIIAGAGIIGSSTALSIKEKDPQKRVLLVERAPYAGGASTRNAGFACFGGLSELRSDRLLRGDTASLDIMERRRQGLALLRRRLTDEELFYEDTGGYELVFEGQEYLVEYLDEANEFLLPLFGKPYFSLLDAAPFRFGKNITSVVSAPGEGLIHSGKMMQALHSKVREAGILLLLGTELLHYEEATGGGVHLHCQTLENANLRLTAEQLLLATNAEIGKFFPETHIKPGRGQIILTESLPELPWKGAFHFDEGYYYFRNVGNKILFGGGRNTDIIGEETFSTDTTSFLVEHLNSILKEVIIPDFPHIEIEKQWAGTMGFNASKEPDIRRMTPAVSIAFGCNGMGVALGSMVGEQAAGILLGS